MEIKTNHERAMNPDESRLKLPFIKFWGLVRWSLIRHKYLLPAFTIIQAAFALAIVYGLALLIPEINESAAIYLSSGSISLGIIAVGCVLAPQIANTSKQDGLFAYQRTLPVGRSAILLADIIIWCIASLPGVFMGCLAAILRFDITLTITPLSIAIILIAQITMICIGFAIAYLLPPNAMALATQLIMIGGLLFSPITYPMDRLPEWTTYIHQYLPFVPTTDLLRSTLFNFGTFSFVDLFVIIIWAIVGFIVSLITLSRRE
ncbi:ABC transporter permease [Aeribacillus pallidus]|uniref:ABC transporter permease n=1 Tax=Aeribacillus composti TaxID=1868734 RepID=UPI002870E229|nr:ABC transporter permease [Aeribacillus pallidus]MED1440268.1 ABC transporter permease [Aeribacillus composti]